MIQPYLPCIEQQTLYSLIHRSKKLGQQVVNTEVSRRTQFANHVHRTIW